jgi:acetyl esterase/lipase
VEYRIYEREGTLPFEAVKDARSAIRWLRQHAATYRIDPDRIVASGNSAGGHLVLCCALADRWNEKTDDLHYSPVPNVLMVTSGVYDLTDQKTEFFRRTIKDKSLFKTISPDFLVRKNIPPTLLIHATGDGNVPFDSAKRFASAMQQAGNSIEFQVIDGNDHFLWFDPKYAAQVGQIRKDFLLKMGYRE